MKKIFKQIFILSVISFIFLIPLIYALDPTECAKGSICKRINHWSGTEDLEDSEHGLVIDQVCYNIINKDSSKDYFIPINSVSEFNAFKAAAPSLNVEVSVCASTPTSTSVTGCTKCADENGYCSFSGTYAVLYGASNTYTSKTLTGGTSCINAVFGDPTPGTVKACYICSTTTTDPVDHEQRTDPITDPSTYNPGTSPVAGVPIIFNMELIPTTEVAPLSPSTNTITQTPATLSDPALPPVTATFIPTTILPSANPTSSPTAGAGVGTNPVASDPVVSTLCEDCSTSTTGTVSASENVAAATGQVSPVTSTSASSSSSETASAATQQAIATATQSGISASDYASSTSSSSTATYVASTLDPSVSVLQTGGTNYVVPTTAQQSGSSDVGASTSSSEGGNDGGGNDGGGGGSVSLPLMKYATK